MRVSRPPSSIDRELLDILERAFAAHAGADAVIDLKDLRAALGVQNEYFASRVLQVLDRNGDGVIKRDEFLAGVRALIAGSDRDRLEFAFRLHDHDGDGSLDRQELLRMMLVSLAESATSQRVFQPAESLVDELLREADADRDGRLNFEEFANHVAKRPHVLRRMVRSEAIWIAPNEELLRYLDKAPKDTVAASASERVFIAIWLVTNAVLVTAFMLPALKSQQNVLVQLGRALSMAIAFNGALILIPMMRRLIGRLRATWFGRLFPLDEAVAFHRVVGHALFGLSLAHAACFVLVYDDAHRGGITRLLFENQRGLTGLLLTAVFTLMWICSLAFVRRTHRFEFFYFTHLLYVAWLGLLIVHAPRVVFWIGVPLLGFVLEQIIRWIRRKKATVTSTHALRSGVTRLEVGKPAGFDANAGDYVYLRIPQIAKFEWHPFTISSAPERNYLTFHVRSLGNWTSALRTYVEEHDEPSQLRAYVDGPYRTPSAHIFAARYAVLIGAGIGVTPFASVLESLVLRGNGSSSRPSRLHHAHFFWVNRDYYAFEWFVSLLTELEKADHAAMLDVHLCMDTGRAGAAALGLELARDARHEAGGVDVFTGLRTHTHLGPPDWELLLGDIVKRHAPDKVDVFFCGPPGLGIKLRPLCERLGMTFREEQF